MSDGELRTPISKRTTFRVRRGGRLGVTIERDRCFETTRTHLFGVFIGAVIIVLSYLIVVQTGKGAKLGIVLAAIGGVIAGLALKEASFLMWGEIVEEVDDA